MEVSAKKFKANCLKLMDEVINTREPVIITKRGKPIAKLVPVAPKKTASLFGYMAGTATVCGDIVAPTDVAWEVESLESDASGRVSQ